jgi:predicted DNA-binding transcriptional regulator AlpA
LSSIVGDPKKGIPAFIPMSRSTWWVKCKTIPGWPQAVKISDRCTAWLAADIIALAHRMAKGDGVRP